MYPIETIVKIFLADLPQIPTICLLLVGKIVLFLYKVKIYRCFLEEK